MAFTIQHHARAVEHETVVSPDLIDEHDWNLVLAGNAGEHLTSELAFADPERRGGNIQHEVAASPNQRIYWIDGVQRPGPKALVIPCVFANCKRHAIAAE
jgi:hypothetical protein